MELLTGRKKPSQCMEVKIISGLEGGRRGDYVMVNVTKYKALNRFHASSIIIFSVVIFASSVRNNLLIKN